MRECLKCGRSIPLTWWGPWCDQCGGVMARPDLLLFRHVATLDGKSGRYSIVYDASARCYAFMYPNRRNPKAGEPGMDLGEFRRSPFLIEHGTLDAMIAMASGVARGDAEQLPELSVAPSATPEERSLVLEF